MLFHSQMDEDELVGSYNPAVAEFQKILNESEIKRFYYGVEDIIQFKQDPSKCIGKNPNILQESNFFCKLCVKPFEKHDFVPHCSSYVHLFRYLKSYYPIEYDRVISPDNLQASIKFVTIFLENIGKRENAANQIPQVVYLDNLVAKFREFKENYPSRNKPVNLDNINIRDLKEINDRDEETVLDNMRSDHLKSLNRRAPNPFLQHLLDSNEDDFVSAPLPYDNASTSEKSQDNYRFVDYQTNIRQRDRGSMKVTRNDERINIKEENDIEMNSEPSNESNPEPVPQVQEASDGIEISHEFLKQLADKIIHIIQTNDDSIIDADFINTCTNFAEMLVEFEYVDVQQMDLLDALIDQSTNLNQPQEQTNQPENHQIIVDNVVIKQEKIY